MKPKEIEDQIEGLLGLNLGGAPPGSLPLYDGSPESSHQRPRILLVLQLKIHLSLVTI